MTYVVDTDIVISFLNGRPAALWLIRQLQPQGLAISLASYGEVWEGIIYGRDSVKQKDGFERFLRGVDLLPLSIDLRRRFAAVRGFLRARGQPIPDMDLLIASTALENGLTLVTRNRRHFGRVPGLQLYEASS